MTSPLLFRDAGPDDLAVVAAAVRGIAEAEGLLHKVVATSADYHRLMFAEGSVLRGVIAERGGDVAGVALWHPIVMTYAGRLGIYIEDVYVPPGFRGQGVGRAIFGELARRAADGGYDRLQWSCKNDNLAAVAFYQRLRAETVEGFTTHRLSGDELAAVAAY